MPTSVLFADLISAYEWVSAGGLSENSAYMSRATGQIHWSSDYNDIEEELPEDIDEPGRYVSVTHKPDLDLGNRLVFHFVEDHLPDLYQEVRDMFRQKGAYSRFKDLLDRQGQLEAWHRYEEQATEAALREWCQGKEVLLEP